MNVKINENVNFKNICGLCGKTFRRKGYYEKHLIKCENIHKSKYLQQADAEAENDMPTYKQLVDLVLELSHKQNKMELELQRMRKFVEKTKKKIDIIEWLNENLPDAEDFNIWLKNIKISEDQLFYIFDNDLIDGIFKILTHYLPITNNKCHPIKCYDQYRNVFYLHSGNVWIKSNEDDILKIIKKINVKIVKKFMEWKEEHKEKIRNDNDFHKTYLEYMNRILGSNKTTEQICSKLKGKIYNYLKCEIKDIIEYEFAF